MKFKLNTILIISGNYYDCRPHFGIGKLKVVLQFFIRNNYGLTKFADG